MLSKLAIGTAQLEQRYGIYNNKKILSKKDFKNILNKMPELGIDTIDTAQSYKDSEKILGEVGVKEFKLITKIKIQNSYIMKNDIAAIIENSLINLKVDNIDTILIHDPSLLLNEKNYEIIHELKTQKKIGKINKIGFSVYSPKETYSLLDLFKPDIIQFPLSIFDRRFEKTGLIKHLKSHSIECHSRSTFMQGLLFKDEKNLIEFKKWSNLFKKWNNWNKLNDIKPLNTAINYVLQVKYIDKMIFGFKSETEFDEVVSAFKNKNLIYPMDIYSLDENLINPSKWKI